MDDLITKNTVHEDNKSIHEVNKNTEGLLHGDNNSPSIIKTISNGKSIIGTISIYHKDGKLHRENDAAVVLDYISGKIKFFFKDDKLSNSSLGAVRVEDSYSTEVYYLNRKYNYYHFTDNETVKTTGQYLILNEKLESKIKYIVDAIVESESLNHKDDDGLPYLEPDIKRDILHLRWSFNQFLEYEVNNDYPNLLRFYKGTLKKAEWFNSEGVHHRVNKPAIIDFENKNNLVYSYYENGVEKESIFKPYKIVVDKQTREPSGEFYFKNKEIQNFYKIYNFSPFYLDDFARELINVNFKI